jgi:hypothetical protein
MVIPAMSSSDDFGIEIYAKQQCQKLHSVHIV